MSHTAIRRERLRANASPGAPHLQVFVAGHDMVGQHHRRILGLQKGRRPKGVGKLSDVLVGGGSPGIIGRRLQHFCGPSAEHSGYRSGLTVAASQTGRADEGPAGDRIDTGHVNSRLDPDRPPT